MTIGRVGRIVGWLLLVGLVCAVDGRGARAETPTPGPGPGFAAAPAPARPSPAQPSTDVLRVEHDRVALPYTVWTKMPPALVTTPDGGAWAFFSAFARRSDGLDGRRLYAARFDPAARVWLPARPLPGGTDQFGPAAVVDRLGTVHLVYSDRTAATAESFATLVYARTTGDGGWDAPVPVAPHPEAGHQMLPALAVDGEDRLHVLWRDQRAVGPELRALDPGNADLFASDLQDGAWSPPVQVNRRPNPTSNASYPNLAVDGGRLVAVWSAYKGTTAKEMEKATRVEWSTRPLNDPTGWSRPQPLLDRADGEVGGPLLDLAADPLGGVGLVYGRLSPNVAPPAVSNTLYLRRLEPGMEEWGGDLPLGSGDFGFSPALAIGPDGAVYVAYDDGRNRAIEVGAVTVPPGATAAPAVVLTTAEDGEHGQAAIAIAADGRPWVAYMRAADGAAPTEIRCLRGPRLTT